MQIQIVVRQSIGLFFQPRPERFREVYQYPGASFGKALLITLVVQIIMAIIGYVGWLAYPFYNGLLENLGVSPVLLLRLAPLLARPVSVLSSINSIAYALLIFILFVYLSSFVAIRINKGEGERGRYAYVMAMYQAVLGIIVSLLIALIPLVGICLGLFFALYGFLLQYRAIKSSFSLDSGKTISTMIITFVILAALMMCGSILIAMSQNVYVGP